MLLSRFWILFLAVVAGVACGAAMLARGMVNRQYDNDLANNLRRDRLVVESTLKLEARAQIDAIAPIAADSDVRAALRAANGRQNDAALNDVSSRLREQLRSLNRQLEGLSADILFAVDRNGVIVAQLGPYERRLGAGLGTFPLVARALAGYVRDDVWTYDTNAYRMAARPVIDGGQYIGAIVHGKKLDDNLAHMLSDRLGGATVGFFRNTQPLGSFVPTDPAGSPSMAELSTPLANVLTEQKVRTGDASDPHPLDSGHGSAIYSLVKGSASALSVGYVIGRPVTHIAAPMDLFSQATTEDFATLPKPMIIVGIVLAFLLGMLIMYFERDMPLMRFRKAVEALGRRAVERLVATEFNGVHRKLAQDINSALDKQAAAGGGDPGRKSVANIDELLGPSPTTGTQPAAFFAFGDAPQSLPPSADDIPKAGKMPPIPPTVVPAKMGAPPPPPPPSAATRAAPGKPTPAPASPPSPAPSPLEMLSLPPTGPSTAAPGPLPTPVVPAMAPAFSNVPSAFDDGDDEGQTMIARVPEELLAQLGDRSSGSQASQADAAAENDGAMTTVSQVKQSPEDQHFRAVFDEFVNVKKQCGEPLQGFTYDKFVQTLKKNKEQIVAKHSASDVKFTVYVKDGKAALKATPVKD
ncbi:MAG: hypothetical protein IPK60_17255 [Sandaracinaceae bacterium]|nr:hypothetical protein [Sandaracinaceae bacterium]